MLGVEISGCLFKSLQSQIRKRKLSVGQVTFFRPIHRRLLLKQQWTQEQDNFTSDSAHVLKQLVLIPLFSLTEIILHLLRQETSQILKLATGPLEHKQN